MNPAKSATPLAEPPDEPAPAPELAFMLQGDVARRLRALAARLGTTPLDELNTAVALHLDAMEAVEVPS